ncbi:MAG: carbamate kinase [Gemmatimonadota bacterium]
MTAPPPWSHPRSIVVALGGNALARSGERATIANQFRHTRESLAPIVELAREGWRIVLVHGNGPQIGDELVRNETAQDLVETLPLGVLVAGTAGWIGYMIQQSLQNALARAGVVREVVTVITQTLVDPPETHLATPSKPIGHALPDASVERLRAREVPVGKDGAGKWRRLASSPVPRGIVEAPLIRQLADSGVIVIAAGGGGPPVFRHPTLGLEGVDAVVDKDRVAAILATELDSEVLVILTDVDAIYHNWGQPDAAPIRRLTLDEALVMLSTSEVAAGSMRPKLEAAVTFLRAGGSRAVIAHLSDGLAALAGHTGTTLVRTP